MGKRVFMFPGQGSQYIGMGKEFYEQIPRAKEVYELANEAAGMDIAALCFEPNENIHITQYTQIAMLATEAAILAALAERGITADAAAGLSLGEYGALIASGTMEMADAFRIVRMRGLFMQEAVPTGGAMSAVIGLAPETIGELCARVSEETGRVASIANYNCPGQIVITGEQSAVEKAGEACTEAGARRVIPLKVSGPFHSALMCGAGERLGKELENVSLHESRIPYLSNVTADYVRSTEEVKPLLIRQVSSPVRWQQTIERLIADGADEFVEIGPGRSLNGFMRKIDRSVKTVSIDTMEDFKNYADR